MSMELKYKSADVEKMIDVFSAINDKKEKKDYKGIVDEMVKLIDYPTYVIQEFLNCMDVLAENHKDDSDIKNNYLGIIGYVVLRLNLVTEDTVKWAPEDM